MAAMQCVPSPDNCVKQTWEQYVSVVKLLMQSEAITFGATDTKPVVFV